GSTGLGADKTSLRLMQIGLLTFLVAAPLDVINHRVNGLDLTAWSPSHMMLYLGTGIMQAGVLLGWLRLSPPGRGQPEPAEQDTGLHDARAQVEHHVGRAPRGQVEAVDAVVDDVERSRDQERQQPDLHQPQRRLVGAETRGA